MRMKGHNRGVIRCYCLQEILAKFAPAAVRFQLEQQIVTIPRFCFTDHMLLVIVCTGDG